MFLEREIRPVDKYNREEEIYLSLPLSDFNGWIHSDDMFWKTHEVINTSRLRNIRSLGNISPIIPDISIKDQHLTLFNHNREEHTFLVADLGTYILRNNNFSDTEIKKYLVAAFLHDIATPAYGDSTKTIDINNLHEEYFWQEVITKETEDYINRIGSNLKEIDEIIKNEGILGITLDIADRITYVMQDASKTPFMNDFIKSNNKDINYLKDKKNSLGNVYKDVIIDKVNNDVYFSDSSKLYDFLLLRTLLYKNVYFHPINQGRDMIIANNIANFYTPDNSQNNLFNPQNLRSMTDDQLLETLAQKINVDSCLLSRQLSSWQPDHYKKFLNTDLALFRSKELEKKGIKVLGVKECFGFNPATEYRTVTSTGEIICYKDFDPIKSSHLQKLADDTKGVYLYYND